MLQAIGITIGDDELKKIDQIGAALNTNRSAVIRWLVRNTEFVPPSVQLKPEAYQGSGEREAVQQ